MKEKNDKLQTFISIGSAVLIIALMVYLLHDITVANKKLYDTQVAELVVEQETVPAKAFVIRDENYIDSNEKGTVVPLVSDGNRVANGDAVARVCSSEDEAASYAALLDARAELERYIALSNQTQQSAVNIEKLNSEIDECFSNLVKTSATSNYENLPSCVETLEDKLAGKQILVSGDSVSFDDKISALNDLIADLEAKRLSPAEVKAECSGYYISNIDGYEKTISYNEAVGLSVPQVEKLFDAKPADVTGKMGKLVGSYKWYIASVIDGKYSKLVKVGDTKKINIPYYGIKNVSVKIESLSDVKDGKIAIVLSCNLMNETFANIRNIDIEFVLNEYEGYKIPATAQQTLVKGDKTFKVVYILRGNYMSARLIDVIYTPEDKDYVIVSTDTKSDSYLEKYEVYTLKAEEETTKEETTTEETTESWQTTVPVEGGKVRKNRKVYVYPISRYDEVIVKGKGLEHGKSVG